MLQEQPPKEEFIPVNQVLNLKPRLGPVPGEQVVPWSIIFLVSYIVCQGLLGLSWMGTGLVAAWGVGTWWCVTGDASWKFLTKFTGVPVWTRGHLPYTGLIASEPSTKRAEKRAEKRAQRQLRQSKRSR